MLIISAKEAVGLKISQPAPQYQEYTYAGIVNRVPLGKNIKTAQPNLDWACTDSEDHLHYWERDEDTGEVSIVTAIEIEEEGERAFYCAECDEQLFPDYHTGLISDAELEFEYHGSQNLSVGELIKIIDHPVYGDISIMISQLSQDMGRGKFSSYKVSGFNADSLVGIEY